MRASLATLFTIGCVGAGLTLAAAAQKTTRVHEGRGGSPHDRTEWAIDGANISIEYGRPLVKGRTIFGGLEPFGKVWRTGADEATTLKTDRTLVFGSLTVPAGAYTLWTWIDDKGPWKLIVNKETGQWGTAYQASQDLGRADMKTETPAGPVEQLTISIDNTPGPGGTLKIEWEKTRATIPFTIK
jgi:hypothetical protein